MKIERSSNVDILKKISFRDAVVPRRDAVTVLTSNTRDCIIDGVQYFRDAAKGFSTEFVDSVTQLLLLDIDSRQGGLVMDEQLIDGYFNKFGRKPFKNIFTNSVQELSFALSQSPERREELCDNAMKLFSDISRLLKPPFTEDDGAHVLAETFQEQSFPPYCVGIMVDYSRNFQVPTETSPSGKVEAYFDRKGAERLRQIYTRLLNPQERTQFLLGSAKSSAIIHQTRYQANQN
jgi:hypothetical protein